MLSVKTTSLRKRSIDKAVNNIISIYPQYTQFVMALCTLQGQMWASKVRNAIKLDYNSLIEAIKENGEYFGIKNVGCSNLKYQDDSLEITDEIISFFDKVLHDKTILDKEEIAVFDEIFYSKKIVVNKRVATKIIEPALIKIFNKYNDSFLELNTKLQNIGNDLDEEIIIAFHDIEILFELSSLFGYYRLRTEDINIREINKTMAKLIKALNTYPFDNDVEQIINLKFKGMKINKISETLNKHHSYVEKRIKMGFEAFEWILWGYTAKYYI